MSMCTVDLESQHWNCGISHVAGTDEAGRGCLAGPVVAAAVVLPHFTTIPGLDDSKKINNPTNRKVLFDNITKIAVAYSICECSHAQIDAMNIRNASLLAMKNAIQDLSTRGVSPGHVLVDGNVKVPKLCVPQTTVVGGDGKSQCIAAASILAKVHRDEVMEGLHEAHPVYAWGRNKGYPTQAHYGALKTHGPSPYHRLSFRLGLQ